MAKQANNAAVNIKGAVSITGASEVVGRLRNPGGALSFDNANTTDTFTVTDFVGGGTLTLNVAFVKDGADTADLFTVTDNIYGAPTTIDITATGDLADLDEDGLLVIDAPASSNTAAFTAGNLAIGETPHGFTLSRDAGSGDWFLRAAAPAPGCHGNNGVFVCSGAITTRRVLSASSGEAISVTDTDGTNFQVYSRYALWVGQTGDADLEVDLDADFTTDTDTHNGASIHASHTGAGDISITADGAIATITGGGIHARHRGAGAVSITANGDIDASRNGIWVDHRGRSGDIAVAANGDIIAEMTDGISVLRGRPRRHLHHRERRHHLPQRRRHQRLSIP